MKVSLFISGDMHKAQRQVPRHIFIGLNAIDIKAINIYSFARCLFALTYKMYELIFYLEKRVQAFLNPILLIS